MMLRLFSLLIACLTVLPCIADSKLQDTLTKWISGSGQQQFHVSFNKQKIQFRGCKQKAYDLLLTKPFTDNFSIDMSLGYAKGSNSFGVYSQTVLIKEYRIMPRWQFDGFALGMGVTMQSSHELRSSHGPDIQLPRQKEYAVEADVPAFAANHKARISLAHQTWQVDELALAGGSYLTENNALTLNYSIIF